MNYTFNHKQTLLMLKKVTRCKQAIRKLELLPWQLTEISEN